MGRGHEPRKREGKEDLRKEHGESKRKENAGYSEWEAAGRWRRVGGRSCKANHVWRSSEGGSLTVQSTHSSGRGQSLVPGTHKEWLITTCDSRSTGSNHSSLCNHVRTPTQRHTHIVKINHEERQRTCSGKLCHCMLSQKKVQKWE